MVMRCREPVSDEELNAYVDGELLRAERQKLAQLIVVDARLRERVSQLERVRTLVRLAFAKTGEVGGKR